MDHQQLDRTFRDAVSAIDAGDQSTLERLLKAKPDAAWERLKTPGPWLCEKFGGKLPDFFRDPYLLWFVAEDPIRNGRLPANIVPMAKVIIKHIRRGNPATLQEQLDYALRLISWSTVARDCGVQIGLIDLLADAGAALDGNPDNALVNRNIVAAEHLVLRGAKLTLSTALCLGRCEDLSRLAANATVSQRQFALVLAALSGKAAALRRLIQLGADVNAPSPDLYCHGTPLHHAVCSGDLETVKVLVEAGADPNAKDTAWQGTPLGWAEHYVQDKKLDEQKKRYASIVSYLRERISANPSVANS